MPDALFSMGQFGFEVALIRTPYELVLPRPESLIYRFVNNVCPEECSVFHSFYAAISEIFSARLPFSANPSSLSNNSDSAFSYYLD